MGILLAADQSQNSLATANLFQALYLLASSFGYLGDVVQGKTCPECFTFFVGRAYQISVR